MRHITTNYSLHRTTSGRLSSGMDTSDEDKGGFKKRVSNLQNWPKPIRDVVVAEPGHVFVAGDWAGIEWAIAMWMCGKVERDGYHDRMLDEFYRGEFDPHRFLASKAFGVPVADVTDGQRQTAKVYTHGRTYDGSPRTLARSAGHRDETGVLVCSAHDSAFKTQGWKAHTLAQVKKKHYTQTPLGWRVYWWDWNPKPTEVLGNLVQGTAADLCKVVLGRIFADTPGGWTVATSTHDSIMLHVPEVDGSDACGWLREYMEAPIPWLDGRRWRCEVKQGPDWKAVS